jgi:hypothetical protein
MKEKLIAILNQFCPDKVFLQGTLNPNEAYPQKFITFFTDVTNDLEHFDNLVIGTAWRFSVMFYSNNPAEVNTIPAQISAALKQAGFIPQGKGNDLMCDKITHTGWAMDFVIRENENI